MYNSLKRIGSDADRIINMINANADMFDIIDTMFANPYKVYNYNPLMRYITMPNTMDMKYPYDYTVNVKYDSDSNVTNVEHVIEIPVAGYNRDDIKIKTKANQLLVEIGQPYKNSSKLDKDISEETNDDSVTEVPSESTHIINRGIKRGYTEIGWNIRGLKPEYIVSKYDNGMLTLTVNIPVAQQKLQSDGWSTIDISESPDKDAQVLNEDTK